VGSGGSYTVATLLCTLHETYTGRVSRASTPLEIIANPTLAAASPMFFVSAEGKNPDIIEAILRARRHSARDLHVLTNRKSSPLQEVSATLSDVTIHNFELRSWTITTIESHFQSTNFASVANLWMNGYPTLAHLPI